MYAKYRYCFLATIVVILNCQFILGKLLLIAVKVVYLKTKILKVSLPTLISVTKFIKIRFLFIFIVDFERVYLRLI